MAIQQNIRLTVDVALFAWSQLGMELLLIQRKDGSWALPGGFVDDDEELKVAAKRELEEETGVSVDNVVQFYAFGDDVNRDPRGHTVSVAHLIVLPKNGLNVKAASDARSAKWVNIQTIPELAFDHNKIVERAILHLNLTINNNLPDAEMIHQNLSESQINEVGEYLNKLA